MHLVSQVLQAHGGAVRWSQVTAFSAHISISGALLPAAEAFVLPFPQRRTAPLEFVVEGDTQRPSLKLFGSTDPSWYSVYSPARVERRSRTHHLLDALDQPAKALAARRFDRPLGTLEALFLCGNAVWNAIIGPFVLADSRTRAIEVPTGEGRQLDVHLPEELDPISPRRLLHISEDGLLLRSDYGIRHLHPEYVVDTLTAYTAFDGILIPTLRRARALDLDGNLDPTPLLDIEIFDVRFY